MSDRNMTPNQDYTHDGEKVVMFVPVNYSSGSLCFLLSYQLSKDSKYRAYIPPLEVIPCYDNNLDRRGVSSDIVLEEKVIENLKNVFDYFVHARDHLWSNNSVPMTFEEFLKQRDPLPEDVSACL